jgi:Putative zinc-finger
VGGQVRALAPVADPAPTPAEQHLGDRLTALVDGELGHESRERVLAHIATCDECRAEVEEQRRLKGILAAASRVAPAPPPGLLARLQSLPGLDQSDDGGPFLGGGLGEGLLRGGTAESVLSAGSAGGFRIHEVTKPAERATAHRGRRFAFAAAGALSMAAVALGGAFPVEEVPSGGLPDEPGTSVTPVSVYSGSSGGALSTEAAPGIPFLLRTPVSLLTSTQDAPLSQVTVTLPGGSRTTSQAATATTATATTARTTATATTPTVLAHRLLP